MLAQPPRRHGLVGVEDRREGVDVGGVQAVGAGETLHEAVDLTVHPPHVHGQGLEVARLRPATGPPFTRVLSAPLRCRHAISV